MSPTAEDKTFSSAPTLPEQSSKGAGYLTPKENEEAIARIKASRTEVIEKFGEG